jgi:hypothetical protein
MPRSHFASLIERAAPWLARAERLLRPRWVVLCRPQAEYGAGLLCLLLALILFLPIPLGNMLPALAICLLALASSSATASGCWPVLSRRSDRSR